MKTKRLLAGLCAALLLAGSFAALPGCGKQIDEITPPAVNSGAVDSVTPPDDGYIGLTEADAQALAAERLPDGLTLTSAGTIDREGNSLADPRADGKEFYYAWDVHDAEGVHVGGIAISSQSGERYNYNGGTGEAVLTDYAEFPLYNAATDAVCNWNGMFQRGETAVELAQSDNNSFDFRFSDGTQGTARITGNTATDGGKLTFTFEDDTTLRIDGEPAALAGSYQK